MRCERAWRCSCRAWNKGVSVLYQKIEELQGRVALALEWIEVCTLAHEADQLLQLDNTPDIEGEMEAQRYEFVRCWSLLHDLLARQRAAPPQPAGGGEWQAVQQIHIYEVGPVYLSVCAPGEMPLRMLTFFVNQARPTGLAHGWAFDEAGEFADGTPNPCPCPDRPRHLHYLFSC